MPSIAYGGGYTVVNSQLHTRARVQQSTRINTVLLQGKQAVLPSRGSRDYCIIPMVKTVAPLSIPSSSLGAG